MKLYNAMAGNPKRVRIFIAEKGIEIPMVELEIGTDTRSSEFRKLNSLPELPVLELDDGQIITESRAICRYLDVRFPENPLMGVTAEEQGHIAMWSERIFWNLFMHYGLMVRHTIPLFADVVDQVPAFAESQRNVIPEKWRWLDEEISDSRPFIAGDSFSFADVEAMTVLMLADAFDLGIPEDCEYVTQWATNMRQRTSWGA